MKRLVNLGMAIATVAVLITAAPADAGRIVVANDEWTLSDTGYVNPANDPGVFALNVANWFTGGGPGNFYGYSTNFGLTQSLLAASLTGGGHAWTTGTSITWDLPTLLGYNGIFLAGNAVPSTAVLIDYVNAGGNVYVAGGTGVVPAPVEAALWNPFLNAFGLGFEPVYNEVCCDIAISSSHPIFAGVDQLYQNNGNSVTDLDLGDPRNQVLVTSAKGGLYAVYDPVPEPGTLLLMSLGLGALGARRRSARR